MCCYYQCHYSVCLLLESSKVIQSQLINIGMRSMQEFICGWVGLCTNVFIFVTEKSITFNLSLFKYFKFWWNAFLPRLLLSPLYFSFKRERVAWRDPIKVAKETAYCRSFNREKIKILRLKFVNSKIYFCVILLRKANWNFVVPLINPNQRYIAISNKWRYIE